MSYKGNTEISKQPLQGPSITRPQSFPRMPRLYLELLENKGKIRPELHDKEFIMDYEQVPGLEPASPDISTTSTSSSITIEIDDKKSVDDNESINKTTNTLDDDRSISSTGSESVSSSISSQSNIDNRLTDLLGEDDHMSIKSHKPTTNKYSKKRNKHGQSIERKSTTAAPSFAELQAQGSYVPRHELKDINNISENARQDEDNKRELLFKFEILRKSYPSGNIPIYTIHTDYQMMLVSYEDCVRRLSLDSSVESYKQYLIYAFMGLEFVLGKFLKLDMEGFTQQQIVSMSSYEKLLIELGEKSYVPEGSKWSVEVRLLFLVIVNTAFFVGTKMIMQKTSVNLMNMMNGLGKKSTPEEPKRKMKGPDIDLDDLP